jgi:hypothetical protein
MIESSRVPSSCQAVALAKAEASATANSRCRHSITFYTNKLCTILPFSHCNNLNPRLNLLKYLDTDLA